jgi:transposase-like protein
MIGETSCHCGVIVASNTSKQQGARRRWPLSEKRRLVELTLRKGVSRQAIALEHGVHPNTLADWKRRFEAGSLGRERRGSNAEATFVPVSVSEPEPARAPAPALPARSVVQLVLDCGATLRIESGALDASLVCALVAQLRQ